MGALLRREDLRPGPRPVQRQPGSRGGARLHRSRAAARRRRRRASTGRRAASASTARTADSGSFSGARRPIHATRSGSPAAGPGTGGAARQLRAAGRAGTRPAARSRAAPRRRRHGRPTPAATGGAPTRPTVRWNAARAGRSQLSPGRIPCPDPWMTSRLGTPAAPARVHGQRGQQVQRPVRDDRVGPAGLLPQRPPAARDQRPSRRPDEAGGQHGVGGRVLAGPPAREHPHLAARCLEQVAERGHELLHATGVRQHEAGHEQHPHGVSAILRRSFRRGVARPVRTGVSSSIVDRSRLTGIVAGDPRRFPDEDPIDVPRYLSALRRGAWLVALIVIPLTATVLVLSLVLPKTYSAVTSLVLERAERCGGRPTPRRRRSGWRRSSGC